MSQHDIRTQATIFAESIDAIIGDSPHRGSGASTTSRSVGTPVAAAASPSSLQLSLENSKLRQTQAAYFDALRSAGESTDDIVGSVFAINGKVTGGDVYASSALFRKMWRKLLIANVTEAISEKNGAKALPPSLDDVHKPDIDRLTKPAGPVESDQIGRTGPLSGCRA
jgi:hypothetical protein